MELRRFLVLLVGGVLAIGALTIWFYPSTGDFRPENPFWNGLSKFVDRFSASPLESYSELPERAEGTSLVVIPYIMPSTPELGKLAKFVSDGGVLIVMNDFGYGNAVLSYLGLAARFYNQPLLDPVFNHKSKNLPKVIDVAGEKQRLVLNHATALNNVAEANVVAWSSPFSYIDLNGDGEYTQGEPSGRSPVAARFKIGMGDVVAIADPSVLINSMLEIEDNENFIRVCLQQYSPNPRILIDVLHLPHTALEESKGILHAIHSRLSTFWGVLAMTVIALLLALRTVWGQSSYRKR